MKNFFIPLLALALLLLAGCSKEEIQPPTNADLMVSTRGTELPFKGRLSVSTSSRTTTPPFIEIFKGGGNMTHFGRVSIVITQYLKGPGTFSGTIDMKAANGDELVLDYSGQLTGYDPSTTIFTSEVDYTVSSGTGRFLGASGEGKGYSVGTSPQFPPAPEDIIRFKIQMDGWISY